MKLLIFSCCMTALMGCFVGMEIGYRQHEAKINTPIYLTKVCPVPAVAKPIPKIECLRACYARERMERVAKQ